VGKSGYGAEENLKWMGEHGKTNPVLEDAEGTVGKAYGAMVTPTVAVIDQNGMVAYFGAFDEAGNPGEAPKGNNLAIGAVDSLLASQPVTVASTKAFG
jgi:hypothetical protein